MRALVLLTIVSFPVSSAVAQEPAPAEVESKPVLVKPSPRQGHYIALGAHLTGAVVDDSFRGTRGPALGQGFTLRLGERLTPHVDVGIAFAYGSVRGEHPWQFGRLTVHGQFYVSERLFLAAGFGFGAAGGDDTDGEDGRGSYGDVYTAGLGYNLYLTDHKKTGGVTVTPVVTAEYSRDSEFANAALWFGVEIGYWFGVSRDQLDLPLDEAYK